MVELLLAEKQSLLRTGWMFGLRDDPAAFETAVRFDVERQRAVGILVDHRDEKSPQASIDEARLRVQAMDREFLRILGGLPAMQTFETCWERSWKIMVDERAWPHATPERRAWRRVMLDTKPETRAAFLGLPTPYQRLDRELRRDIADRDEDLATITAGALVA